MKYGLSFIFLLIGLLSQAQTDSLVEFVDPFIGVRDDVSNCVIGPQLPFGSVNPSPQTPDGNHDGYHPGREIRGFGQLHVSGTGWGKYGQVFISPQVGMKVGETEHDSPKSDEVAKAYEYSVNLTRYNVKVSLAPSYHSVFYKFQYPKTDSAFVLLDLTHNIPMDIAGIGGSVHDGEVNLRDSVIFGYATYSGGFGPGNYSVYFYAVIDKDKASSGVWKNGNIIEGDTLCSINEINDRIGAYINLQTDSAEEVLFKIGVSFKSVDQAKYWLTKEIPGWDYGVVKQDAKLAWNNQLNKIKIETTSEEEKVLFYTALYHSMIMPRDRTNDFNGFTEEEQVWDDQYALWDTWRTLFPLMALINPGMVSGNVNSFINRYNKAPGHNIKDAFIAGYDMPEEQGGNNMDNIIADAFFKNIPNVDWDAAYNVLLYNATSQRRGWQGWGNFNVTSYNMARYKSWGWIPNGQMSCSYTLEYAYNDYCASTVAEALGKTDDYDKWFVRSVKWQHLWNPDASSDGFSGFIVPRKTNFEFVSIDLKKNWGSWSDYFYEGNSWTYSYLIPHQFHKLIELCGGNEDFATRLVHGFKNGLIDASNETGFLASQAFHYANRPDLASYWMDKIRKNGYTRLGYPGNDDSGAMSSWFVFSGIGIFPNSGQPLYFLNTPKYPKSVLYLNNSDSLVISSENFSDGNIYIKSCTINGFEYDQSWLPHDSIKNGGTIHFVLDDKPSSWGTQNSLPVFDRALDTLDLPNSTGLIQNKNVGLCQNIPNPFHDQTIIQGFLNPEYNSAFLHVYDVYGRRVKTIQINQEKEYTVTLDASKLDQGIYFYSLVCDGSVIDTKKMIVH